MTSLPIPRSLLEKYFGDDRRMVIAMDDISRAAADTTSPVGSAALTNAMAAETVVTISPGNGFANEVVFAAGFGIILDINPGSISVRVDPQLFVTTSAPVFKLSTIGNFTSDANAAAGGVPIGGIYRNGSALQIRAT